MAARDGGPVTGDESTVIVVRAWRDRGRLIIRVLAGSGDTRSAREWVFGDVDGSLACVEQLLAELRDAAVRDETKR